MRTLFIGALSTALIGCSSCLVPLQTSLNACTQTDGSACYDGVSETAPAELKPLSIKPHLARKRATIALATRTDMSPAKGDESRVTEKPKPVVTEKPAPAPAKGDEPRVTEKPKPAVTEKPAPAPDKGDEPTVTEKPKPADADKAAASTSQTMEISDPILMKAKTTVAAETEIPESAKFKDMKRAMRMNMLGKPMDTICGYVRGKTASGADTGDMPFLYLVKEDQAYVVKGDIDRVAAGVYHTICVWAAR